jgi:enoyl-CoA hydratase/carnithine racemase
MPTDIDVGHDGDVDIITINRPEIRNALRFQTYDELEAAVRQSAARAIVITGADPAFCSGDDVREVMGGGEQRDRPIISTPRLTPAADAILHSNIPVIAAVNGAAVGWGMELALMADIRIASDRAKFGELFVLRGLCTDVCGIGRLASVVGRDRAARLLFTGDVIPADEALRIGLVSEVVAHTELLPTATALAQTIAARPPLAVAAIKEGMRAALDPDWNDLGVWVSTSLARLFRTEDHREGVKSFLEKRQPQFVGR